MKIPEKQKRRMIEKVGLFLMIAGFGMMIHISIQDLLGLIESTELVSGVLMFGLMWAFGTFVYIFTNSEYKTVTKYEKVK